MTTKTIASSWDFFSCFIHPEASKSQRRGMKLAFYAGCFAVLKMQREEITLDMPEDEACALIESWWQECAKFPESFEKSGNPES